MRKCSLKTIKHNFLCIFLDKLKTSVLANERTCNNRKKIKLTCTSSAWSMMHGNRCNWRQNSWSSWRFKLGDVPLLLRTSAVLKRKTIDRVYNKYAHLFFYLPPPTFPCEVLFIVSTKEFHFGSIISPMWYQSKYYGPKIMLIRNCSLCQYTLYTGSQREMLRLCLTMVIDGILIDAKL